MVPQGLAETGLELVSNGVCSPPPHRFLLKVDFQIKRVVKVSLGMGEEVEANVLTQELGDVQAASEVKGRDPSACPARPPGPAIH